jgi:hypothetical protein
MTLRQALRLAIRAIQAECKRLAFDANLAERLGADYPGAREAARLRAQYRQAIDLLSAGTAGDDEGQPSPAAGKAGKRPTV